MCGFAGRISFEPGKTLPPILRALGALRRRGPDSHATWVSPDGRVELLHTRLAIVDQDDRALQPFTSALGTTTVAFNGEIYNYPEIRSGLDGYPYISNSDTEVIVAAFERHGVSAFNLFRGMYALALVDTAQRRIILARDPVGKKPLFVCKENDSITFGSSVMAIAAISSHPLELDQNGFSYYWRFGFPDPRRSLLKKVFPVLPGQILEFSWMGHAYPARHHSPKPAALFGGESDAKVAETVSGLLTIAVERRLRDNPNPTVLCSGGIDSTVVTQRALESAARLPASTSVRVLTLGAMFPGMNDEAFARFAAWKLGTPIETIRMAGGPLPQLVRRCLALQDEPLGMISFFPLSRLVAAASRTSKILLTGDGGDEVFLGYGKPEMWRWTYDDQPPRTPFPCGPPPPLWMSAWGSAMATEHLAGHNFCKVDRASAEQGVEVRCPLLDWDLMAYARSLPESALLPEGVLKALLKAQLAGWPRWFLERPKLGFTLNLRWTWAAIGFAGLRDLVRSDAVDTFAPQLPSSLAMPPSQWKTLSIFRSFPNVWKLVAWSAFLDRLAAARQTSS